MGFLGQRYAETIPWAKVEFWWILRKIVKNINNRQREAQKLEIALALALGMCIHSHSALVPAVPAENVGIPREDDFSHLFQWRRSSLRESLCALGEPGENGKTDTPSLLLLTLLLQRCSWETGKTGTPRGMSYKRHSIAAIFHSVVSEKRSHRNSWRSIFVVWKRIGSYTYKRYSIAKVRYFIGKVRSEIDASAILLVARRVAGTRKFPSTVSESAISLPAPGVFQWKTADACLYWPITPVYIHRWALHLLITVAGHR